MSAIYPKISKKTFLEMLRNGKSQRKKAEKTFIVDGEKGVLEALNSGWLINQIIVDENLSRKYNHINFSKQKMFFASSSQISQICKVQTSAGILAEVIIPEPKPIQKKANIVFLYDISDPGNLGSIIRSCDWFGIKNIIITNNTVNPYNPKVIRATMGSIYRVNLEISTNHIQRLLELKTQGYSLIASTVNGSTHTKAKTPYCLILGNESLGLKPEVINIASSTFTIPKYGQAESLNVAVAGAIILHELNKQP